MESYWEAIEPLFSLVNYGESPEKFSRSVVSWPRHSVILFAAHMCLAEVYNGGFLQLFWNTTGVLVPEGIEGFTEIEMPKMSSLIQAAARPLGTPYPRDRDERWDALLAASKRSESELTDIFERHKDQAKGLYAVFAEATKSLPFDELDREFWAYAKTENGGFQRAATRYANRTRTTQ